MIDASVLPLSKASTAGVAKTLQLGTVLSLSSSSYNKNVKEEEEGPYDAADVMGGSVSRRNRNDYLIWPWHPRRVRKDRPTIWDWDFVPTTKFSSFPLPLSRETHW
eukprot:scaffold5126_cov29-Attheya_sp.AAC.4